MKRKTAIKKLMGYGISRNDAHHILNWGSEKSVPNWIPVWIVQILYERKTRRIIPKGHIGFNTDYIIVDEL